MSLSKENNQFSELKTFIENNDAITIFSHVYPDGDSYGSLIGIKELILKSYPHKKVFALGSPLFSFSALLGPLDKVEDEVIRNSAAIIVDVGNRARIEDQRFSLASSLFKIDHHIFAEDFTDFSLINTNRIAASEIVGEFMIEHNLDISPLGATALVLGIFTDSGRFNYDLTTSLTFKVVSELMNKGADLKGINKTLGQRNIDSLKSRGYFLTNYQVEDNVIFAIVETKTLNELGILPSQGGMFVNSYSNITDYPLWATFFETEEGKYFAELRSSSKNVQKVAVSFGGGGHLKASGCLLENKEQISELIKKLKEAEDL